MRFIGGWCNHLCTPQKGLTIILCSRALDVHLQRVIDLINGRISGWTVFFALPHCLRQGLLKLIMERLKMLCHQLHLQ